MSKCDLNVMESTVNNFEEEFWKRAASFNLKPENFKISSDVFNSLDDESIDNYLSGIIQKKMNLPCKVIGKSICIKLPGRKDIVI